MSVKNLKTSSCISAMPDKVDAFSGKRRLAGAYHLRGKQDLNFVNWLRSARCNEPKTCPHVRHPTITSSILLLSFTARSKGQVLSPSPPIFLARKVLPRKITTKKNLSARKLVPGSDDSRTGLKFLCKNKVTFGEKAGESAI